MIKIILHLVAGAGLLATGGRAAWSQTADVEPSDPGGTANLPATDRFLPDVATLNRGDRSWFDVIGPSLLGPLRPELWHPLRARDFFRDGWNEQYAPAPDPGTDGSPRQTWINNADGAFYRLFVFSFGYARRLPGNLDAYNGSYFLFTPLNRRFEIGWFFPFVASAPDAFSSGTARYWTQPGDLTVAPRFLLAEDRRYSVTSNLFVRLPTGSVRNGNGVASLSPDLEFWVDLPGRWVVRGGVGVTVPTNRTEGRASYLNFAPFSGFNATPATFTSFDARLAVGHHLTPGDAKYFPNFVYYVATNLHTQLDGGSNNYFSLTPGYRFGIGNNWYFLGGIEIPLVGPLPFQTQTTFQLIKNF